MKTHKIKIKLPKDAGDLILQDYLDFLLELKTIQDEEGNIKSETELNEILINSFVGIDKDLIPLIKGSQVNQIIEKITPMINKEDWPLIRKFTLNGIEFGFIPDLEEATYGEWLDADSYVTQPQEHHKLMAVLFRPITNQRTIKGVDVYNIEEYKDTKEHADAMRLIPLDVYFGAFSFFVNIGMELLQAVPSYLEEQIATKEVQDILSNSEINGVNILGSINSLKETLQGYKKFLK